jgi:hypothetical protein
MNSCEKAAAGREQPLATRNSGYKVTLGNTRRVRRSGYAKSRASHPNAQRGDQVEREAATPDVDQPRFSG